MSTRSGTLVKESLAMVSVKSKVDFDSPGVETELLRPPTWKTAKSCRLDFGEHDPFAPLHCPDLLPNPIDVDSVTKTSHKEKRTIYDADQKATLEAMFRKKKFLTRKEEATLAAQLGININKVQLPAQLQEPSQPLISAPLLATFPFTPASHQTFIQSHLASLEKQLDPQQPLPVLRPLFVTEIGSLLHQKLYPPLPDQLHRLPLQLETKDHVLQTAAAPSHTVHHSPPPVSRPLYFLGPLPYQHVYQPSPSPVQELPQQKPDNKLHFQNPAVPARHSPSVSHADSKAQEDAAKDFKRVTKEFPFVYSFAKELPYIFGNLENDRPPLKELSCGFMPKERSFEFYRQN
ncbi:hypothetical protein ACROYT_G033863 [Oculina patagonica]